MSESQNGNGPKVIDVTPEQWVHRLVIKEPAPEGVIWEKNHFNGDLGSMARIKVWGEVRTGYFLVEADVTNGGQAAVLTFDLYDIGEPG
jgi:hypothetical protein